MKPDRELVRVLWDDVEKHLEEQGFELVELELVRQGRQRVLRVYMDKDGGVTLDDCVVVSRVLSPALDKTALLEESYSLEVSSPGFDRPVRKQADFERFAGSMIRIRTVAPLEGRRKFTGRLEGFEDGCVLLECDGKPVQIHLENVERANLVR